MHGNGRVSLLNGFSAANVIAFVSTATDAQRRRLTRFLPPKLARHVPSCALNLVFQNSIGQALATEVDRSHGPEALYTTMHKNTWKMSFKHTKCGFRDRSHANFPSEGGVNLLQEGQFHIPLSANLPTAQGRSPNSAFMRDGKYISCQNATLQAISGSRCLIHCNPGILDYNRLSA